MSYKIKFSILLLAAAPIFVMGRTASAQSFTAPSVQKLVLAAGCTDPSKTLTLKAPAMPLGSISLTLPGQNASGVMLNDGTGSLSWFSLGGLVTNPMTSPGDMIYGGLLGAPTRLAATSTANQILLSGASGAPSWSTATYPATSGSAGNYLRSDGTNFVSSSIQALDVPTLNQNTTGSAAKLTTARTIAGNSFDGSANITFSNKFIVQGTSDAGLTGAQFLGSLGTGLVKNTTATGVLSIATAGTDYSAGTSALATGIVKSTTATGALTIAVAGDFPILNQNTTGTAANVTGVVALANGGTGVTNASGVAQNAVFAGPSVGGAGAASWRTLTATDIPTLSGTYLPLAGGAMAGDITIGAHNVTGTTGAFTGGSLVLTGTSHNGTITVPAGLAQATAYTIPDPGAASATIALTSSNITGSAAKLTTARTIAGNSFDGSANITFSNKFIVQGTSDAGLTGAQFLGSLGTGLVKNTTATGVLSIATAGTDYSVGTSALATGIVKSTTATGALTIAAAGDFPTLNQNSTGTANIAGGTVGAIPYQSAANTTTVLAATATANQVMLSGASAAPAWSTATYPTTTGASQLLYSNGANTITGLATANNGVLATNSSGVPSISSAPTLGVAGTSTGSLSFANTVGANLTTIQAGVSAPAVTYSLPATTPLTGQVLTLGTVTGAGPYTAPLTWVTPTTGTVTAVSVATANGFAGASSGGATPALTLSTTITGMLKGNGTAISAATSGTDYSAGTSALATGIVKSTTATGALTIAVAGDFPTLNQSTTGNAATATNATNVGTTLQTASASTFYPTFVPSNTTSAGQAADVATGLSYVPSTGTLSATIFSGALSGNATGFTGNLAGDVTGPQGTTAINTTSAAGGHIISALTANAGTLTNNTSGNATTATTATNATNVATTLQTASASTFYPTFVPSNTTSAGQAADVATGLSYVPSTGTFSSTNFVGALTGNITGNATGTAANVTGTVTVAHGGTGQVTANAGFNALSPMTTLGDIIYGAAAGVATRLPGNTTLAKQFLTQTGAAGPVSAAPVWAAILPADLSGAGVEYGPASTQNTVAAGATKLFDIAYAAASGANATDAGAAITANASGATNGTATGLSITTTGSGTGTSTGLSITTNGGAANPQIVLGGTTSGIVTSALADVYYEETGDTYGTSRLHMQNRNGSNGALFEMIPNAANPTINLVDFGFKPGSIAQSNIRLEARPGTLRASGNGSATIPEEFQMFFGTTTTPEYVFEVGEAATLLEVGNFGIGYSANVNTSPVALPLEKLDVHGSASTASNIILSNTGVAGTNGLPGTLKFQGTRDGLSTFTAGAQGSNTYNYTLPITTPAANQVLAATAVSGATPFAVTLGWANAVVNPMTGTGDMIYGGAAGVATRLAATATANQMMLSGASAAPAWSTATYPPTTTINQVLYSSAANTVTGLATGNNGVLITSAGGVPSISSTLPAAVQGNITSTGVVTSGTWHGTTVTAAYGGTGVTTASANTVFAGPSSGAAAAPTFRTLTGADLAAASGSTGSVAVLTRNSSDLTTSGTSLANATGLSFSIGANEIWSVDFELSCNAASAGGMAFGITIPAGATIEANSMGVRAGINNYQCDRITTSGTATLIQYAKSSDGPVRITGLVVNGSTAGTIQLQFLSGSNGTNVTIYKNSYGLANRF